MHNSKLCEADVQYRQNWFCHLLFFSYKCRGPLKNLTSMNSKTESLGQGICSSDMARDLDACLALLSLMHLSRCTHSCLNSCNVPERSPLVSSSLTDSARPILKWFLRLILIHSVSEVHLLNCYVVPNRTITLFKYSYSLLCCRVLIRVSMLPNCHDFEVLSPSSAKIAICPVFI